MPFMDPSARAAPRSALLLLALACGLSSPREARAQSDDEARIIRLGATPIGALPPIAMPMPASRNHNYWGARLQAGYRRDRAGANLTAIAGGIDFQWLGGSVFGVTGGYQMGDCVDAAAACTDHALFGARGRFNVMTGGPTLTALIGDYSANTTLGAELGLGWAPDVLPEMDACAVDFGVPISIAMLQRIRVVTYVAPGVMWDIDCPGGGDHATRASWFTSLGIGVQQLGGRGLDVSIGYQKIFREGSGDQFGVSIMYVRVP
ncbi:MAG TPA: hypothetical protein VMN78_12385 [Longimicrobiales bacterium]|nr:hypothetical protein [Longimicrobiales bacterium]